MATSFHEDWRVQLAPRQTLVIWAAVSLLVSFVGPFSTFASMSFPLRLAYWGGLIGLSIPLAALLRVVFRRALPGWPLIWADLVAGLGFAALFTPVVYAATLLLSNLHGVSMVPIWMMFLSILLAVSIVTVVRSVLIPQAVQAEVAQSRPSLAVQPAPRPSPRLMERLGPDLRAPVLHLSVEDHYVLVTTEKGRAKLLMRFADAIAELDGAAGLQVHRSHWVAHAAITEVVRVGAQLQLRLSNGAVVPVSRTFREDVLAQV